jgi:adenylate cyclase
MFADMVGYTALTQSNEALALSLLETQKGVILPLVREHGGTPVKTIGDAHLAEFSSALEAVRCAMDIQRSMRQRAGNVPPEQQFKLRIGIHVGDVIHKENDVFGDAVNIASRIQPLADPGGVCISQQVYDQVQNKVDFRLEKLPQRQLKNVSTVIEVYRVIETEPDLRTMPEPDMPRERVAILPLSNYSPSPQDEYLADGMTEELITAISGIQGLRVIARTSVMRFKSAQSDIGEIGRTLNAGSVLEGSFRKIGERIRVTVQLVDARTQEHSWASNYDGDMKDIFTIQTDIANKVAQAIEGKLLERAVAAPRSVDIEAYELYLKGRHSWNRRNAEGVREAFKLFNSALARDPSIAKAYSGLADCYIIGSGLQVFNRHEAEEKAEAAIQKAIELDDGMAEAHASRGLLRNNNQRFAEAVTELKHALSLNPSYASAHHWYAICLANIGNLDAAIEEAKLASQSDPLSPPARNILGVMYVYARQYDRAFEVFDSVLGLDPDFAPTLNYRSNVFSYLGKEEEAVRDMERGIQHATEFEKSVSRLFAKLAFGHKEEAQKDLAEAEKTAPSQGLLFMVRAGYSALAGDPDGFFKWIGQAVEAKEIDPSEIRYGPWLDDMRKDARYADLLKSLPV